MVMSQRKSCFLFTFGVLSFLWTVSTAVGDSNHDEVHKLIESAGEAICKTPHLTEYNRTCFVSIVADYFGRYNWCSSTYKKCFLCNRTSLMSMGDQLYALSITGGVVKEKDLEKLSIALMVLTHDISEFCKSPNVMPNLNYTGYWTKMASETKFKVNKESWLEHVYEDLGKKFVKIKNTKCVTHKTIISESGAKLQSNSEMWAQKVSLFSVLHVLNGYQLDGICVNLPSSASIANSLYKALGLSSTADRITEDKLKKIMSILGIKNGTSVTSGGGHAGHNHRRKRSVENLRRSKRATTIVQTNVSQCLSADNIFSIYGVDESRGATLSEFQKLCPALLEQKIVGACNKAKTKPKVSYAQAFGFGALTVFIISAAALAGLIFIPCMEKRIFDFIMLFTIALAIGTLICDSFLHLIPEALGIHEHAHSKTFELPKPYFWKLFLLVCVIFILYATELVIVYWFSDVGHGHSHGPTDNVELRKVEVNGVQNIAFTLDDEEAVAIKNPMESQDTLSTDTNAVRNTWITALFVLGGDSIHNFADGLAIGAAFSSSLSGGISTAIAVFCHELPHELGDLAVLLSTKMSIKKAVLLNFFSACCAFIGLFIGIPVSSNEGVRGWIFALTAGIFIYISLSNMLSSIKQARPGAKCVSFLVQTGGFFFGILLIFILGLMESQIHISLQ